MSKSRSPPLAGHHAGRGAITYSLSRSHPLSWGTRPAHADLADDFPFTPLSWGTQLCTIYRAGLLAITPTLVGNTTTA